MPNPLFAVPLNMGTGTWIVTIIAGLTFPSVRITLAALLEGTSDSDYLYDSAKKDKTFIPYWLKKARKD